MRQLFTNTFSKPLGLCVAVYAAVAFATLPAQASTQGSVGQNSTGTMNISVTKTSMSRISGISDMAVQWDISSDEIVWTNDICIYSSRASGAYRVMGQGATAAGGAFVLLNGPHQVPYSVSWNAGGAGNLSNEGAALVPGISLTHLTKASTTSTNCTNEASNARIIVNISKQILQAVPVGNYSESLTLIVAPD